MNTDIEYGLISRKTPEFFLPVTQIEYDRAVEARRIMLFARDIEEKLDILIQNYADHERGLNETALRFSVWPSQTDLADADRLLVTRLILNLLSSARMYLDQLDHDISHTYGKDSPWRAAFRTLRHFEWDNRREYRIMEAMRNFSQHRGLPAHTITYESERDDDGPYADLLRNTVTVTAQVDRLIADGKIKDKVLEDIKQAAQGGALDVPPLVRSYVEGIGHIHVQLRVILNASFISSEMIFRTLFARAMMAIVPILAGTGKEDRLDSLSVVRRTADGAVIDRQWIGSEIIDRRDQLESKNKHVDSLTKRYSVYLKPRVVR